MIMFVTDFNPQFQFLITMLVTVLVEFTSSLHALRSKRTSQATASNSGSYKVNFVLPDELPSNHFIGNIPDQLPTFPLNSGSDFSVSTTVIDAAGLAPRLVHASDSGDLYTSASLDRDNPDQLCGPLNCCKLLVCNLTFTVLFVHPRWKTLSVQVNLQFHDTNDNEPRFPQETFSIWIPENNALEKAPAERNPDIIGTMYGIPHAHDYDSEPNGVIAYALIGSTVTKRTFALYSNETTGQLAVIVQPGARIDHENLAERIFKLTVEARDGGSPPRRGEMLIMIHITDLNDNVPVFESPKHSIQLAEHTMYSEPIYVVHASDLDSDDNGMIRYMFGSSYPTMPDSVRRRFSLHPVTGELYLRQTLDYESYEERRIELTFIAYDAGNPPLSATMTLAIVVQDINDNPPELVVQANHTIVENTEPNQLALRLLLRDLDEVSSNSVSCEPDSNLQVPLRYDKSPDGTIFSIYTKSSIDFEETPRLYYGITCTDFVEPRQIRRFNMTVLVKDVNDNSPIFRLDNSGQMRLYNVSVSEAEPSNNLVYVVLADDADSGEYGRIVYSLTDLDISFKNQFGSVGPFDLFGFRSYFTIDEDTGGIFLTRRLDYEISHSMTFGVIAMDNPNGAEYNRHTATVAVRVNILDINDNAPTLVGPSEFALVEHVPIGTNVGVIRFTDADTGTGGVVQIQGLLSDVSVGVNAGSMAVDVQSFLDNRMNASHFFKLTDAGQLVTMQSIDREKTPIFHLRVLAIDGGEVLQLETTATVTVRIIDINDHAPILRHPEPNSTIVIQPALINHPEKLRLYKITNTAQTSETVPYITNLSTLIKEYKHLSNMHFSDYITAPTVLKLEAEDKDIGLNAEMSFEILPQCNGSQYFSVNDKSGELHFKLQRVKQTTTEATLTISDFQWIPSIGIYHIQLKISDNGKPPLSTFVQFWMKIDVPVAKLNGYALWPSDATGMENFGIVTDTDSSIDSITKNSVVVGDVTAFHDELPADSDNSFGSVTVSNAIIAALVAIFAITFVCALAAALLWAQSKRRKSRLTEQRSFADITQPVCSGDCSKWLMEDREVKPSLLLTQNETLAKNACGTFTPLLTSVDAVAAGSTEAKTASSVAQTRCSPATLFNKSVQEFAFTTNDVFPCPNRNKRQQNNPNNIGLQLITTMCDVVPRCESQQGSTEDTMLNSLSFQFTPEDSYSLNMPVKFSHKTYTTLTSTLTTPTTLESLSTQGIPCDNSRQKITCVPIPVVSELSIECPTHGPQLLLHSQPNCSTEIEGADLKSQYYTVRAVSDLPYVNAVKCNENKTDFVCDAHRLGGNNLSDGEVKAVSWISVPLLTDPLGGGNVTTSFICLDPGVIENGNEATDRHFAT